MVGQFHFAQHPQVALGVKAAHELRLTHPGYPGAAGTARAADLIIVVTAERPSGIPHSADRGQSERAEAFGSLSEILAASFSSDRRDSGPENLGSADGCCNVTETLIRIGFGG
jgi:hypothetical protein